MTKKLEIKIDPEFSSLIHPISDAELKELEESIKKEGCRDALVIYKGLILDGHNRYNICKKHKIEFETIEVPGVRNRDEAKLWVIRNHFARRNLNTYQKAILALRLKPLIEKEAIKRQKSGKAVQESERGRTLDKIAKIIGISRTTLWKAERIQKGIEKGEISESVKEKLEAGEVSINHVRNEILREYRKKEPRPFYESIKKIRYKISSLTYDFVSLREKIHSFREYSPERGTFINSLVMLLTQIEYFRTHTTVKKSEEENLIDGTYNEEIFSQWEDWMRFE